MQSSSIPPQAVQAVLDVVDAYIQEFRPPLAQPFLQQIFESSVPNLNQFKLEKSQVNQVLQEAMGRFNPAIALGKTLPANSRAIVPKIYGQLKNFKSGQDVSQVLDILDAYIQQTKPPLSRTFLYPVVTSIIPHLSNLKLDQLGVQQLANQVMLKFVPETALTKILGPKAGAIAAIVAQQMQHFQPEQAVMGIVNTMEAQLQSKMTPTEAALYQLAKMVLSQVIDLPFHQGTTQQLATQVMFRYNSPAGPIKSSEQMAKEIAAQLDQEVNQLRAIRAKNFPPANITKASVFGDLEVGINIIKKPS